MGTGYQKLEALDPNMQREGSTFNKDLHPVVLNKKFIANIEIDSFHTGISELRKTISVPSSLKQEDRGGGRGQIQGREKINECYPSPHPKKRKGEFRPRHGKTVHTQLGFSRFVAPGPGAR